MVEEPTGNRVNKAFIRIPPDCGGPLSLENTLFRSSGIFLIMAPTVFFKFRKRTAYVITNIFFVTFLQLNPIQHFESITGTSKNYFQVLGGANKMYSPQVVPELTCGCQVCNSSDRWQWFEKEATPSWSFRSARYRMFLSYYRTTGLIRSTCSLVAASSTTSSIPPPLLSTDINLFLHNILISFIAIKHLNVRWRRICSLESAALTLKIHRHGSFQNLQLFLEQCSK